MRILYITRGDHVDYQNDCLLIGLKELFGSDVVDVNKQHHNYDSFPAEYANRMYGRGFSMTRVLPDLPVDRTDILNKIRNRYFDFIIYGSIWRVPGSRQDLPQILFNPYLLEILEFYPKNRIIAVDGNDYEEIHPIFDLGITYFKREISKLQPNLYPISFAIPECKVNFRKNKIKDESFITPMDTNTYIYNSEKDYYNDYGEARFGVTMKKGGWDCMRHYEILANGCIPKFLDIDNCPDLTMSFFPKKLCSEVLIDLKSISPTDVYDKYIDRFEDNFRKHLTTKALAKYVVETITKNL
jgi:hypothetical protein